MAFFEEINNLAFSDELISNDPPNKDNPFKSYFTQIGSARPIRGLNFRTPIMRIKMHWESVKISSEKYFLLNLECFMTFFLL